MTDRSLLAVECDPGYYDVYCGRRCAERLLATRVDLRTVLSEQVDFLAHETLRRCGRDATETYRVLRFSLPTSCGVVGGDEWVGRGALVSVRYRLDPEDDGYVRGWFEGVRETLGELVDVGAVTLPEAFDRLVDAVRRFGAHRDLLLDPERRSR